MHQTWLIAGPPGCGKTNWIREKLLKHQGPCAFLRLDGWSHEGLEAGMNAGIDLTWLSDQCPQLIDLSPAALYDPASDHIEFLTVADRSGASKLGFG
tara:strand:- start:591 stop:881 length:291 start_codon:yes stop_codon:yes gene_type:complete